MLCLVCQHKNEHLDLVHRPTSFLDGVKAAFSVLKKEGEKHWLEEEVRRGLEGRFHLNGDVKVPSGSLQRERALDIALNALTVDAASPERRQEKSVQQPAPPSIPTAPPSIPIAPPSVPTAMVASQSQVGSRSRPESTTSVSSPAVPSTSVTPSSPWSLGDVVPQSQNPLAHPEQVPPLSIVSSYLFRPVHGGQSLVLHSPPYYFDHHRMWALVLGLGALPPVAQLMERVRNLEVQPSGPHAPVLVALASLLDPNVGNPNVKGALHYLVAETTNPSTTNRIRSILRLLLLKIHTSLKEHEMRGFVNQVFKFTINLDIFRNPNPGREWEEFVNRECNVTPAVVVINLILRDGLPELVFVPPHHISINGRSYRYSKQRLASGVLGRKWVGGGGWDYRPFLPAQPGLWQKLDPRPTTSQLTTLRIHDLKAEKKQDGRYQAPLILFYLRDDTYTMNQEDSPSPVTL